MSEEQKVKTPRAKWSDAVVLRLRSKLGNDSSGGWLLTALTHCNVAPGTIDQALRAPEGTTRTYLHSAEPINFTCQQDGAELLAVVDDVEADMVTEALARLKTAGAFTPRGLDLAAVLAVVMHTDTRTR